MRPPVSGRLRARRRMSDATVPDPGRLPAATRRIEAGVRTPQSAPTSACVLAQATGSVRHQPAPTARSPTAVGRRTRYMRSLP